MLKQAEFYGYIEFQQVSFDSVTETGLRPLPLCFSIVIIVTKLHLRSSHTIEANDALNTIVRNTSNV
jgi:hypothetical protein